MLPRQEVIHPEVSRSPKFHNVWEKAAAVQWLAWQTPCHPILRQLRNPGISLMPEEAWVQQVPRGTCEHRMLGGVTPHTLSKHR